MEAGEWVTYPIQTGVQCIDSIRFCVMSREKVALVITGCNPTYDEELSDVFDVSGLVSEKLKGGEMKCEIDMVGFLKFRVYIFRHLVGKLRLVAKLFKKN